MAQFLRPDSDITLNTWVDEAQATTDIFNSIDEVTASETDYISTANNPSAVTGTFGLSSATDPVSSTGHELRWRYNKSGSGGRTIDIQLELVDTTNGTIVTRSFTAVSDVIAQDSYTLSAGEADNITDYSTLTFIVTGDASGGGAGRRAQVSWLELEIPNGSGPTYNTAAVGKVSTATIAKIGGVAIANITTVGKVTI